MSEDASWVRAFDVVVGIIALTLGTIVLTSSVFPFPLVELVLVWMVGIGLFFFGLITLIRAFMMKVVMWRKILWMIAGLLLIIFGLLSFAYSFIALTIIIMLMGLGIVIYGALILLLGFMDPEATGGQKAVSSLMGLFMVIIGILVIIYYATWGTAILIAFISIWLLVNGTWRLLQGATGQY